MSSEQVDLSRRGFLRGRQFTKCGRAEDRKTRGPLGPLLSWFDAMSLESCGDCAAPCLTACSPAVLRRHPDDHPLAATPWLDFSASGCTRCGDCAEACPSVTQATDPADAILGEVVLDAGRCHAWNGVLCMSCIGRCDRGALGFDMRRRLLLDMQNCNGCGACVAPCPAQALSVVPLPRKQPESRS